MDSSNPQRSAVGINLGRHGHGRIPGSRRNGHHKPASRHQHAETFSRQVKGAYYNEIDPQKAAWLRENIKAGLCAPGEVDERSIADVQPEDLKEFAQCHFFAGIGVWSYALRRAGWADQSGVWTGSCPCQSFSASGKRGGFSDQRHLWPQWFRLIEQCGPHVCFGEQVASKDGLAWFDVVSADLERAGYTIGAQDLCAAGFGAPHIRQRLYFVAQHALRVRWTGRGDGDTPRDEGPLQTAGRIATGSPVAHAPERSSEGLRSIVGDAGKQGLAQREHGGSNSGEDIFSPAGQSAEPTGHASGLTNGFWAGADWIPCRDGKARPVESGSFPLAHGATERVLRLRGYGDAIVAPVAQAFIEAFIEVSTE